MLMPVLDSLATHHPRCSSAGIKLVHLLHFSERMRTLIRNAASLTSSTSQFGVISEMRYDCAILFCLCGIPHFGTRTEVVNPSQCRLFLEEWSSVTEVAEQATLHRFPGRQGWYSDRRSVLCR